MVTIGPHQAVDNVQHQCGTVSFDSCHVCPFRMHSVL